MCLSKHTDEIQEITANSLDALTLRDKFHFGIGTKAMITKLA